MSLLLALPLAATPAEADVPVSNYDAVPQSEHETSLWLPDRSELMLLSAAEDLVVVDLSTGNLSTIPGTQGLVSLSTGMDEHLVYGAAQSTNELVEIDLVSADVRRWPLAGEACPRDVIARGDYFYFIGNSVAVNRLQLSRPPVAPGPELRRSLASARSDGPWIQSAFAALRTGCPAIRRVRGQLGCDRDDVRSH